MFKLKILININKYRKDSVFITVGSTLASKTESDSSRKNHNLNSSTIRLDNNHMRSCLTYG